MPTFSERLNKALELTNTTAAELSRKTGISEATISNYRKGAYAPKGLRTTLIAEALCVNVEWLQGITDDPFRHRFTGDTPGARLSRAMNGLNDAGWEKVIEYATDLNDNKKYTR